MLKLLVDDREQSVIPYFKETYLAKLNQTIEVEVKRLQIADYCIMHNEKILFAIERKTWRDLSASIKDGRDSNIDKMLSLREQTNCKLLFLIEGNTRYNPKKKFSRIPYKNLQAKLDHLMIRDNVSIIYSNDEEDTTNRLIEFCTNYLSLNIAKSSEIVVKGAAESILTTVIKKTDEQITQNLWNSIPQITTKTSELFINNGFHISDLLLGEISELDIAALKYTNGTIIGKRASKILKITKGPEENYKHYCNILAEIPCITKKTAAIILINVTFIELLNGKLSLEDLANIKKTEKSKIGKAAAANIYKFLIKK
jgi:ERCC4-type nuclease